MQFSNEHLCLDIFQLDCKGLILCFSTNVTSMSKMSAYQILVSLNMEGSKVSCYSAIYMDIKYNIPNENCIVVFIKSIF